MRLVKSKMADIIVLFFSVSLRCFACRHTPPDGCEYSLLQPAPDALVSAGRLLPLPV